MAAVSRECHVNDSGIFSKSAAVRPKVSVSNHGRRDLPSAKLSPLFWTADVRGTVQADGLASPQQEVRQI